MIEDGSVIVRLKTGEKLRLDTNQFVTLEDGSLIVANEIALASSPTLLWPKSPNTLTPPIDEQVTSISLTEIAGSSSQLASISIDPTLGQSGLAGLERYELAQAGIESVKGAGEDLQAGLTVLPLSMLLLDMLTAKDQQGQTEENTEPTVPETPEPPEPPETPGPIWTDAEVPNSDDFEIIGSAGSAWIGYTEPNATNTDPIPDLAHNSTVTIDMRASGPTKLNAASAAARSGLLKYFGGTEADSLTFTDLAHAGSATFDMSLGGNNSFAGSIIVSGSGTFAYTGGPDNDSVSFQGIGIGGSATFDMSLGGNNFFNGSMIGRNATPYSASTTLSYMGGPDDDVIVMEDGGRTGSSVTFDLSLGGDNRLELNPTQRFHDISYVGGRDSDSISIGGPNIGDLCLTGTFDMSLGGNNTVVGPSDLQDGSQSRIREFSYVGGSGEDSLTFGGQLAYQTGLVTFDMSLGGNNTLVVGQAGASSWGTINYIGGNGSDDLTFGDRLAMNFGSVALDLGSDIVADVVTFEGLIGTHGNSPGSVTIQNFDFNADIVNVSAGVSASVSEITDADGNLTWSDSDGLHTIVFEGIGTGGSGTLATAAQLVDAIV